MAQASPQEFSLEGLANLEEVLELLESIRDLALPLTSAAGLQQALSLLVQLAGVLGVDSQWTARLTSILQDPAVFNVVLAFVQFVLSSVQPAGANPSPAPGATSVAAIDEQTLSQLLPLVGPIVRLIRRIRGEQ